MVDRLLCIHSPNRRDFLLGYPGRLLTQDKLLGCGAESKRERELARCDLEESVAHFGNGCYSKLGQYQPFESTYMGDHIRDCGIE